MKTVRKFLYWSSFKNVTVTEIYRNKARTGNGDPYSKKREISNDIAMDFLLKAEKILGEEKDLKSFIKSTIAGNIMDLRTWIRQ